MCGLAGYLGATNGDRQEILARMAASIGHRGPDGTGLWRDDEAGLGFAHNRLAIVDLSPAGDQPMTSPSGRWVIAYNGEIYNHMDLRRELEVDGYVPGWRGHSDTETLLAAIDRWGVEGALGRAIGMFAFALWDKAERRLILARDRLGEKPLYYGWQRSGGNRTFLFGSELKALRRHPAFEGEIDRQALTAFLRLNYVPAPLSIYRGISKLPPGAILTLAAGADEPAIHFYWSGAEVAERGAADPLRLGPDEATDALEALLRDAVARQMVADVPLGAFLSGGVDSSTIVALMQAQSSRPVKTFSIGFSEEAYNEAHQAKAVAGHLGTDHSELYVSPADAMAVIPRLGSMYDEPFADSSQIPTFLVSQLARRDVTVSLSGDAGDELFGGYNRHRMVAGPWRRLSRIPRPLRGAAAKGLRAVSPERWNRVAAALDPLLPRAARMRLPGEKIHKAAGVLASRSVDDLYLGLVSFWRDPASAVRGGSEAAGTLNGLAPRLAGLGDAERMMALDMLTYLPDDILAKVDRAAMSVSLETRVPFLDHRVVELAWRLPIELKIRNGETKWLLRRVLDRHVPRALVDRPKMGFGVPIDSWLRGPLRDWGESLLADERLAGEGYFEAAPIRAAWDAHQKGAANMQHHLWSVLMFQTWLEADKEDAAAAPRPRRRTAA
ncbi:MAG TPA: asparagine synthase (glutamine-hydrolyzing) [Allosphingosinicella sp.]|jgi:asparagine synthase (glutamine-hydrolysing)